MLHTRREKRERMMMLPITMAAIAPPLEIV
jgi:hypothetical protein